jgi:hypothetical protein
MVGLLIIVGLGVLLVCLVFGWVWHDKRMDTLQRRMDTLEDDAEEAWALLKSLSYAEWEWPERVP